MPVVVVSGMQITCTGNPGHGSRFIENTAVEKVVSMATMYLMCTFMHAIVLHCVRTCSVSHVYHGWHIGCEY